MSDGYLQQILEHIKVNDALPEGAFVIFGRNHAVLSIGGENHRFEWDGIEWVDGQLQPMNLRRVALDATQPGAGE